MDFEYALAMFQIPLASLEPHLKPPVGPLPAQEMEEASPEEGVNREVLVKLLGDELDGAHEKAARSYIPDHLPPFPSKHTYLWTDKESARETDPRKIREEASKGARLAEESLRRLVNVSKAGREKEMKRVAEKDSKSKMRHELFEKTVDTLSTRKEEVPDQTDHRSLIVNSHSQHNRKSAAKKKLAPNIPDASA